MSHKLQEGREEPVKRTLQGTVNGAWRFLWGRLTLHGCDGPYKVLHYKILRRSRTNEHPARRAGVFWVRRRAEHDCNLTLDVTFPVRREVGASERCAVMWGDDLLGVVCRMLGQVVSIRCAEPVLEAACTEGVPT